ncbi:MAG: bacillithiol biosynthesis deacetylase BshB1 [Chitinophagales bacterium]|nr:bacillithiol biosynthesis deacetylase BshB1 [Chitinophagaceae bacterium]MCB9064719.1 bacillithiol biosynthesis deacetylase BshB1 [Chitinophagales bacterium]
MQKLDILAIGVHPDDIELSCAGTLIKHVSLGQKVGILDLTQGELGTRGTPELRLQEAQDAAAIMGVHVRENAGMADGFFRNDQEHQLKLITYIRKYQPDIVIANALKDRHPDHGRAGKLIADSCFLAGLRKVETSLDGADQKAWRPKRVFHMIQDRFIDPSFIVDITNSFSKKMEAVQAYKSQFHDPNSIEPVTYIATDGFLKQIEARAMLLGKRIGVAYGEGFVSENIPGVNSLNDLVLPHLA